ncbi:MAG: amidohydrolase family protein [Steroidobacteraceae bacterium]
MGCNAQRIERLSASLGVSAPDLRADPCQLAGVADEKNRALSVTTPGAQGEADARLALTRAQKANDALAAQIQKRPNRYAGLAHLPLQDPTAAADELARCVHEFDFRGAMINGHSNGHYLDEEIYSPFCERVQDLEVPIYLYPCDPYDMPHMYLGRPELLGATWS